ncbi:MAG TPA: exodeoxyribonuclease VII large subunit [Vicinamibacteria bacterium]|nr:exodeoxyribonuclease VII large subunit [Vicinamibacteria bacterium]
MSTQLKFDEGRSVYSVTELTRDIKLSLERTFVNLWVAGELSNLKLHSSGHYYFTLKDEQAQIPAVLFRGSTRHLRFRPQDGMAVLVWGHVTVYEPKGAYQIRVERMEPRGKGSLQLAFEQLKDKLGKEGLFDQARKKPIPLLPQRLAIVTSPSGAALRDICRVLHRRFPNLEVVVYPAQVQGDLAAAEIAQGIRVLNRLAGFDVLIVARGGGSLEDLWPFNEESVARAIAASRIPVMSAVGHEVDFTIADFVADVRAPTPSAAAEMVVRNKDEFRERVLNLKARLEKSARYRFRELRARVDAIAAHKAFAAVRHGIETRAQRVDESSHRARFHMARRAARLRQRLQDLSARLADQRVDRRLGETRTRLARLLARLEAAERARVHRGRRAFGEVASKLDALSPLSVLGRGYSLAWSAQGKLLRSSEEAEVGDAVRLDLARGRLHCRVEKRDG